MSSIHMSLIFTIFWLLLFCDFHLHQIHRNHLAQNDLSPVSHKTRGPFLDIRFNLLATPSTSLNFQSVALPWFSAPLVPLYPPSLPALTPEQHEVLKDFLLGRLACLSCSPFLLWLHLLSRFPVLFSVDHPCHLQAQCGSWKGHFHEPVGQWPSPLPSSPHSFDVSPFCA